MAIDPKSSYYDGVDYSGNEIEAMRVMEAFGDGDVHKINAIRYLLRLGRKGEVDDWARDLEKIMVYLAEWRNHRDGDDGA